MTDPAPRPNDRRSRIHALRPDVSPVGSNRGRDALPSDADLIAAIADGEVAALERLYDRYGALVYSVCIRILRDAQLAEDVVQEVYLRIWRQPTSFDPERGRFVSWLMSVSRNRALDELRRRTRRYAGEEREDASVPEPRATDRLDDPEVGVELAELREVVREAMTRLPPVQRRAIELAYFGGLTQQEIADLTGDPLGTVKTRMRLGMRKLRDALAGFAGDGTREADR